MDIFPTPWLNSKNTLSCSCNINVVETCNIGVVKYKFDLPSRSELIMQVKTKNLQTFPDNALIPLTDILFNNKLVKNLMG